MLRLLSDEDVHDDIVRGLRRREPRLDIVRAVDVGLRRTPDKMILEWSATELRVLVTGDLNTMIGAAWERVLAGAPIPGVLALLENVGVGRVIEDILLAALCLAPEEMQNQVMHVPLSSVGDEQ